MPSIKIDRHELFKYGGRALFSFDPVMELVTMKLGQKPGSISYCPLDGYGKWKEEIEVKYEVLNGDFSDIFDMQWTGWPTGA